MFKKGFTLAEVLITLMIIGIVAALTIPSVISNYQQQEFKTGLKKAVSVLNEAIQTNIAQEGETPYESWDVFRYLKRHMSIVGNAVDGTSERTREFTQNDVFYTTDGMRFEEMQGANSDKFILHESGLSARDYKYLPCSGPPTGLCMDMNMACGSYGLAANPNNTTNTPCVILVDVNGDRKPNPTGQPVEHTYWANGAISGSTYPDYIYPTPSDKKITDIFPILITEEKAIPFGVVAQRAMYSK